MAYSSNDRLSSGLLRIRRYVTISTALTTGDSSVTISYGTPSKTTTQTITVRELESITVKTNPTLTYTVGNTFDPTGLVLQLNYTAGDPSEVAYSVGNADEFTFTFQDASSDLDPQPEKLTTAVKKVKIKYAGKAVTRALTVEKAVATATFESESVTVLPSEASTYDLTSNTLSVKVGETAVDESKYTATYKVKGPEAEDYEEVDDETSVTLAEGATTVQVSFESTDYTIATVTFTATVKPAGITLSTITIADDAATITGSLGATWNLTGGKFYLSTDETFTNKVGNELSLTANDNDTKTFTVTDVSGLFLLQTRGFRCILSSDYYGRKSPKGEIPL